MRTLHKSLLVMKMTACLAGLAFAPGAWALYVGMYAIGDFVPSGSGGCDGNDIAAWPGMAQAWWDEMGARGHYKGPGASPYRYVDGNMTVRRLCDPNLALGADCRDYQSSWPAGVDWMDAAIIASHGWDDGDRWGAIMRYPWNGDCALRFGGTSGGRNMAVGDSWVQFLIGSSCQSADDDNLAGIRHAMQDASTSSIRRAHQFDGFHGIMWISSSFNGNYRDTAAEGHSGPISYAWVTNHYKNNDFECAWWDPFGWGGTCQDQCPIAYSIGTSAADASNRLLNERYNTAFSDPAGNNYYWYLYYEGCNPVGENVFGSAD
jgi:hypothetical protein